MYRHGICLTDDVYVHPSGLVYLEATKGWTIGRTPVAYGMVVVARLDEGQATCHGSPVIVHLDLLAHSHRLRLCVGHGKT
jgi:hypothetical protein